MTPSIIDRLMEPGTPFAMGGGAGELADVTDRPNALPGANILRQRTEVDFAVVIITENLSQDNNAAAAGDIEALKTYVRSKLLGFKPTGMIEFLQHVDGELQQALGGVVWFEDVFTGAYFLEKTQ